jgi:hypothetical protein
MPSAIDSKAMSLSVRLLRQNRSVETALRKDQELTEVDAENGRLFIGRAPRPTELASVRGAVRNRTRLAAP